MKDLIAKLKSDATCAMGALWIHMDSREAHIDAQAARIAELEAQIAAKSAPVVEQQPVAWSYECQQNAEGTVWSEFINRTKPKLTERDGVRNIKPLYAAPQTADTDKLREALKMAIIQNSCDMLMTGEEMRQCEAALASTALQAPVREVPGWISVDVRYPELTIRNENKVVIENRSIPPMTSSEKVIVCLDDGNRRIDRAVRLDGSEYTFFQSYGARVKYWQALPAAPVQEPKP